MATPNNGFEGIIVYTIHKDGCLNGIYYATGNPKGYTYNEIARKTNDSVLEKEQDKNDSEKQEPIVGDYVCSWIEENNKQVSGTLHIQQRNNLGTFKVTWQENGTDKFKGTGFLLDDKTFAVHYTYAK